MLASPQARRGFRPNCTGLSVTANVMSHCERSTHVVDEKNGRDSEDKFDDTDDTSGQKTDSTTGTGTSKTNLFEDGGSVVGDSIHTSPLLQSLATGTKHKSVKKGLRGEQPLVLEHSDAEVDILLTISLLGGLTLDKTLSLKGTELVLDFGGIFGRVPETSQVDKTFLLTTYQDED